MGLFDVFRVSQIKKENERLKSLMTPELQQIDMQLSKLDCLNIEVQSVERKVNQLESQKQKLYIDIKQAKSKLVEINDEVLMQEFGLYKPKYAFSNSDHYKERLDITRQSQKELIKKGLAITSAPNWTVNNSRAQGVKLVKEISKLMLRAFNSECDEVVRNVKYNNITASHNKIEMSARTISTLGKTMGISVTNDYLKLKIEELYIAFEYAQKKQDEKEAAKAARAEMREAEKLQKELNEKRTKSEKERTHYEKALAQIEQKLKSEPDSFDLIEKKKELEAHLAEIEATLKDLDYREANVKAGYVYIISNIGAFGENVYKIGMTRRLEPTDRIDELSDASVPFNFDIHAMIFSDNAPALEAALHNAFENKKLNMVNPRKEFFNVSLDEIKQVVRSNYDKTVDWIDIPDAQQYRQSLKMISVQTQ